MQLLQPFAHRVGAADDDVALVDELLVGVLAEGLDARLHDALQAAAADVARREQVLELVLEALAEQPDHVLLGVLVGLLVGLGHVDRQHRAELLRGGLVAVLAARPRVRRRASASSASVGA